MKAVSVKELKQELKHKDPNELLELCLRLSKFKKENKELLTYLLFESENEEVYIVSVKAEIDDMFEQINTRSYFYIKKTLRKILTSIRRYSRYSLKKETEAELLIYFCSLKNRLPRSYRNDTRIENVFDKQVIAIKKKLKNLHEDLQYDFSQELNEITGEGKSEE